MKARHAASPSASLIELVFGILRSAQLHGAPEERFDWLVDMLAICHDLATAELRESWRKRKAARWYVGSQVRAGLPLRP